MAEAIALRPVPLTRARFAPYGDVIDASHDAVQSMNEARFERFDDLCRVDVGDGDVAISVTRARTDINIFPTVRIERLVEAAAQFINEWNGKR